MVSKEIKKQKFAIKSTEECVIVLAGTAERPRLAVFRSNNHMYAQIIDDTVGNTLYAASTIGQEM